MGNVGVGAYQILPKVKGATPILIIMIYETASSCGPSAFLERQNGISQHRTGTCQTKVSCLVGISILSLRGLLADQQHEPLRAHKYPIPKEAHCGVQIKVSLSESMVV